MSGIGPGGVLLAQRYELAAELCRGLRVLDLGDAPRAARFPLEESAGELTVGSAASGVDVVVALAGVGEELARELEHRAAAGARVLAAFEHSGGQSESPRATRSAEDAARSLADRLAGAAVLPQFFAEGAIVGPPDPTDPPQLELRGASARVEDAAALIVASGFEQDALARARATLRLTASPVLLSYIRGLETAHAELLRANRQLMRERTGREGSAAASLLNAQRELEEMRVIAREHEAQVRRVEAWYDAPRYHLVDRLRTTMTRLPGLPGFIRFLWSLISTRAESPQLDAAAHPEPSEDADDPATVTREREGLEAEEAKEPTEASAPLEG